MALQVYCNTLLIFVTNATNLIMANHSFSNPHSLLLFDALIILSTKMICEGYNTLSFVFRHLFGRMSQEMKNLVEDFLVEFYIWHTWKMTRERKSDEKRLPCCEQRQSEPAGSLSPKFTCDWNLRDLGSSLLCTLITRVNDPHVEYVLFLFQFFSTD